jgi:cell division protein FtsB
MRLVASLSIGVVTLCATARAADAPAADEAKDREIRQLRDRVRELEARIAELEKQPKPTGGAADAGPAAGDAGRAALRARVRERMARDSKKYTRDQLREAETLYQAANKDWRSPVARASLEKMIATYPDLNRTGCATLYLAQWSKGEEREALLKTAIEKYGDCYYGNGVQVGAYARFLLALQLLEAKQADAARALFEEIRTDYADAIDHRGRSLVEQIPKG